MIIGSDEILPLSDFLRNLEDATRGVLLVEATKAGDSSPSLCTGWLITDRLAVIPGYAAIPGYVMQPDSPAADRFLCWMDDATRSIQARLVHLPAAANPIGPALLELDAPESGRALRLDVTSPEHGLRIAVPQYPQGARQTQLSLGRVTGLSDGRIRHDASTLAGSGGAPVLSVRTFEVIGMHVRGVTGRSTYNEAVALTELLKELRSSASWDEIAQHQRLADVGAAFAAPAAMPTSPAGQQVVNESTSSVPDLAVLAAALCWSVDPATLDPETHNRLLPLVGDPEDPRWSLLGDERKRLIKEASSLEVLQRARAASRGTDPGQRTIDRILDGPPFDLTEVADEDFPYWLQAVGWFADVVPDLPSPADVHKIMTRQRVRGRLSAVAGPRLWGREAELGRLRTWYRDSTAGPMAVTGIGGVGKSALVAQFALGLPPGTVLAWLDFDRADLAPDDAMSILGVLAEQLSAQLGEFTAFPAADASAWAQSADQLGAALAPGVTPDKPPLLVLDGFEIAQHVDRHEEIWGVLDRILARVPAIRVIVSGRALVPELTLAGQRGDAMHLTGLAPDAASAWLLDRGVTDPAVLAAVLQITQGVPLLLKMAARLIEAGGDAQAIPAALSRDLVEGFLYQRILDRVVDWALRPLARDALQLRLLSAEMIQEVLGDGIPGGLDALAVFERLSHELALVEAIDARPATAGADRDQLRLRPEVRAATLRLLELDDVQRVREIDHRAAEWYSGQDHTDVTVASELVYHRLRLGDIPGAERAWVRGCAWLLRDAEQEIPEAFESARAWLRDQTHGAQDPGVALITWEQEAHQRIRSALSRELVRVVPSILGERQDRSPDSPLSVYDAWARWQLDDDLTEARAGLTAAGPAQGPTGRERAILGALLAAQAGDRLAADDLLIPFDSFSKWNDRLDGDVEALALRAARVQLTVDLRDELDLAEMLQVPATADRLKNVLRAVLTPADLVLPSLSQMFQRPSSYRMPPAIPAKPTVSYEFAKKLDQERSKSTGGRLPDVLLLAPYDALLPRRTEAWTARELGLARPTTAERLPVPLEAGVDLGLGLAVLARRRWEIAAHTTFLARALDPVVQGSVMDTLRFAVLCTTAVFHGQPLQYQDHDLKDLLRKAVGDTRPPCGPALSATRSAAAKAAILRELPRQVGETLDGLSSHDFPAPGWPSLLRSDGWRTGANLLAVYLLSPDPLELLSRRLLGIPERATSGS